MNRRFVAFVASCTLAWTSTSNAQNRTLTSEGYTLVVPDEWEVIEESKTIFTVRAPKENETDSFGENIRVVRHSVGKSYSVSEVLRRQKSDTGRFKLIGEGTVNDSQVPMAWMATNHDVQRYFPKANYVHVWNCTTGILLSVAMSFDRKGNALEVWEGNDEPLISSDRSYRESSPVSQ